MGQRSEAAFCALPCVRAAAGTAVGRAPLQRFAQRHCRLAQPGLQLVSAFPSYLLFPAGDVVEAA